MRRFDFYYDFSCPYAYLAHTQVDALAARTGAVAQYKPFLLGGVFRALGNAAGPAPSMPSAKARLNLLDMHRWADHFGAPLVMPATHPNRTVLALRATIASGDIPRASKAMFRAYWARGLDISRPEVVASALGEVGFDGEAIVRLADEEATRSELRVRTDEAIEAGVFGAPAFVVDGALYWGQDRMDFVEEALGGAAVRVTAPSSPPPGAPARVVEFYFDFSSPFAYLGACKIEAAAARQGARVVLRPFLLGALFRAIGTPDVPLFEMSEPKRRHSASDVDRWARRAGVELRFPSSFPINSVKPLRVFLALDADAQRRAMLPIFQACWVHDRDISSDEVLSAILKDIGVDAEATLLRAQSPAIKQRLRDATSEAERAGVCGAPSFIVGDQVFWGQDRLLFVEKALAGWRPSLPGGSTQEARA